MYHIAAFSCGTFYENYTEARLGYYRAEYYYGGCGNFKEAIDLLGFNFTATWKFGRFIAAVGALLVWTIFFAVGAAAFVEYPHPTKRYIVIIAVCMGVVALFSLLLLVGLSEGYTLGGVGYMAVVSAFLWTGAAVSMFFCMKLRLRPLATTGDSEISAVIGKLSPTNLPAKVPNNPIKNSGDSVTAAPTMYSNTESVQVPYEDPLSEEYEDEVIGENEASVIYTHEEKKKNVEMEEFREVDLDDQREPEIHLYKEEQDPQVRLEQVEPEGKSVIKMNNEASSPAPPKQSVPAGDRKPLDP
jgi:hypothetical protein